MSNQTDRIQKQVLLRATRTRVWRAITDSAQFGVWFGVKFEHPFVAGTAMVGRMVPTQMDPEIARMQADFEGKPFRMTVGRIEPETLFSFNWHPFAVDFEKDYSSEPMTEVVFSLREVEGGVLLTITESGFDAIPPERRAKAFAANDRGWALQATLVERFLAAHAR